MTTLTGNALTYFQLVSLKGAVKLEAKGMKRRGKSATMIVRQMFNLPVGTSRDVLVERLEQEIKEFQE
jgi:hypothetical protein